MRTKEYLRTFFEETDKIPEDYVFVIKHNKQTHVIEADHLIDIIVNHTPNHEQRKIADIIRWIDFHNGDILHFLNHLAKGYVVRNF